MNFSVQVLCCTAPLLMVKASSHGKQFLLIPDYLLEITFAHKCPVRTSRLLTSLDSQLLTMQHNLQVAPITSGLRCHLCAHRVPLLGESRRSLLVSQQHPSLLS